MVPDAGSGEDGAGEHTKQMSIEAMQLQAYGRDVRWTAYFYYKNYSAPTIVQFIARQIRKHHMILSKTKPCGCLLKFL